MKNVKVYITEGDVKALESAKRILDHYEKNYIGKQSVQFEIDNFDSIIKDFKEALK